METFNISKHNFCQETYTTDGTGYKLESQEFGNKDSNFKNNFLNQKTLKFFRSLGGKEKILQRSKFGLGCTISESISPDGNTKKLTYFFY